MDRGSPSDQFIFTARLARVYRVGGEFVAGLEHVDLAVQRGAFAALVGPSGSGKSTLLNLVGGLDRPSSGRLVVDGRDLTRVSPKELARYRREVVGFVFQAFRLLAHLTALENVALPLLLGGAQVGAAERRATDVLERVGLGSRLRHRPSQLSGGEQQRVAIARAVAHGPRLLLADEPTGNLDAGSAQQILEMLLAIQRQDGLTLVMATHNTEVAARADRVYHLRPGQMTKGSIAA